ncbi:MAG TPA: hypothetical protein VMH24_06155, partial [Candidatus Sulfotelmatobacter sp.]|nr:hypothetical protein [Candidatus Sulfotelmatobacter sp.]
PGISPFQVTTTTRVVALALTPDLPAVTVGEAVSIVLPDQSTTTGTVEAVGPPPPGTASSGGSGAGGSPPGGGNSSNEPQVSALATITLDHPEPTGTADGVAVEVALAVQSARGVLAVPIAALLALAGGGYGVEVAEPSGAHRLVGVTTGVFTGSQVEVRGDGLAPGTRVVVAQ